MNRIFAAGPEHGLRQAMRLIAPIRFVQTDPVELHHRIPQQIVERFAFMLGGDDPVHPQLDQAAHKTKNIAVFGEL